MQEALELAQTVSNAAAMWGLGVKYATFYRARKKATEHAGSAIGDRHAAAVDDGVATDAVAQISSEAKKRTHPRALTDAQRACILDTLGSDQFIDCSPAHVYAALLDEGTYIGSERTMYRVLRANQPIKDRRNQRQHQHYAAPELVATAPNRVWSWDITRLKGPIAGTWYYLYVIIDIYSRYVVGWSVYDREREELAKHLIATTCERQGITRGQLTLHADRGSAMRSKAVAELLDYLKVTKSHSRPYCSNDNPYSESQFKTMKYSSGYPARFGSIQDARVYCAGFSGWYNTVHLHSGIAMVTPASVHYGTADEVLARRATVLARAYEEHPDRFVKGQPKAKQLPGAVWINEPKVQTAVASASEQQRGGDRQRPAIINRDQRGSIVA